MKLKYLFISLLNIIRIWSDRIDVEQLEDITNEIASLHKSMKNLMEIVFTFSPLLALSTVMYHPCHTLPVHSRAFLCIPVHSLSFFHVPVIFRFLIIPFRTSLHYSFTFPFQARAMMSLINRLSSQLGQIIFYPFIVYVSVHLRTIPLTPLLLSTFTFLR